MWCAGTDLITLISAAVTIANHTKLQTYPESCTLTDASVWNYKCWISPISNYRSHNLELDLQMLNAHTHIRLRINRGNNPDCNASMYFSQAWDPDHLPFVTVSNSHMWRLYNLHDTTNTRARCVIGLLLLAAATPATLTAGKFSFPASNYRWSIIEWWSVPHDTLIIDRLLWT